MNNSKSRAKFRGYWIRDKNIAMTAQWDLYEASIDNVHVTALNENRYRVDLAWKGLEAKYRPRTVARTCKLLKASGCTAVSSMVVTPPDGFAEGMEKIENTTDW